MESTQVSTQVGPSKDTQVKHLTNTQVITRCDNCYCITYTMMDDDGNRYCGKCGGKKWR